MSPLLSDMKETTTLAHGDAALDFLDDHDAIYFTKEEEQSIVRKFDRVLMPLVRERNAELGPRSKLTFLQLLSGNRWRYRTRFGSWRKM